MATDKKYLDLTGLQALHTKRALVVHPTNTPASAAAVKVGTDQYGHVIIGGAITPADIGISGSPMKFKGISTTDPAAGGATVAGVSSWSAGDVVLYKRSGETNYEEYLNKDGTNVAGSWELLGDADSYALKSVSITGTGALSGGGTLESNRTITHNAGAQNATTAAPVKVGADAYGHVIIGSALGASTATDGAHTHGFSGNISISANKVMTSTTANKTNYTWSINPGTSNANKVNAATKASSATTVGNANYGSDITIWGVKSGTNSTTSASAVSGGSEVVYGTADVGTAVTGIAKRAASKVTYGNANYGNEMSIWGLASSGGELTTTSASVVSTSTEVTYGNANVGTAVTGIAKRAASKVTYGNANYGSEISITGVSGSTGAHSASYDSTNERLILTAVTVPIAASSATTFRPATVSESQLYPCMDGDSGAVSITPATSSSTKMNKYTFGSVDVPVATTTATTFRPATVSSSQAYPCMDGDSGVVSIAPAVAADTTRKIKGSYTITPVTVPIRAESGTTFKPATVSETTIYGVGDEVSVWKSTADITVGTVSSGGTALVTSITDNKAAVTSAGTCSGSTDSGDGAHDHTITIS